MKTTVQTAGEAKKNANTSTMVLNDQKAKELLESVENTQSRIDAALNLLHDALENAINNEAVAKEESKNNGSGCFKTIYLTLNPEEVEETEEPIEPEESGLTCEELTALAKETVRKLAREMYANYYEAREAIEHFREEYYKYDGTDGPSYEMIEWMERLYNYHYAYEEDEEYEEELYGDEDEYALDVLNSEYEESVEDLAYSMENYKHHLENALVAAKHVCEQYGGKPTSAYMKHLYELENEVGDAFIRLRNQYNVTEYTRKQLEEYEAKSVEGACL